MNICPRQSPVDVLAYWTWRKKGRDVKMTEDFGPLLTGWRMLLNLKRLLWDQRGFWGVGG